MEFKTERSRLPSGLRIPQFRPWGIAMAKTTKSNRTSGGTATIHDQKLDARQRRRTASDRRRATAGPDDAAGRTRLRRPELAEDRRARADAARGLPLPREDLPLRPRADPRARRARPRLRRARLLRDLRVAGEVHPRRPVPARRREDAGLRALLDRRRQQGLVRPRPRRPRLRREALHAGGQLGPRRQQHPGVLHPGRDQVPRHRPRREAGARPRLSRRRSRRTTTSGTSSR